MTKKVTREQAFEHYIALGSERSLSKLEARYRSDTGVIPVSSATLWRWSGKCRWQAKLAEHDEKVATQVEDKLVKAQADERWNAAKAYRDAARDAIKRAVDLLPTIELKSGADLKALFDSAIALISKADVLEGGVSNRIEEIVEPEYRGLGKFRRKAEQAKEGDDER